MSPSLLATAFADLHSPVALQTGRYLKLVHMEVKQKKGKDFRSVVLCNHCTWIYSWILGCNQSFVVQEVLENCLLPGVR